MVREGTCDCVTDIAQLYNADEFAEHLVCAFIDHMGGVCPDMMDYAIERLVARLIHIAVWCRDENLEHNERKTLDATANYLFGLSKTAPAALKVIMDEAAKRREPANAHN